jgi:hypothetical protein
MTDFMHNQKVIQVIGHFTPDRKTKNAGLNVKPRGLGIRLVLYRDVFRSQQLG